MVHVHKLLAPSCLTSHPLLLKGLGTYLRFLNAFAWFLGLQCADAGRADVSCTTSRAAALIASTLSLCTSYDNGLRMGSSENAVGRSTPPLEAPSHLAE